MRIGIDCRLSGPTHAGIGRYIENLVVWLITLRPDYEWYLFFYDKKQYQNHKQLQSLVKQYPKQIIVRYISIKHYSLAEQLILPWVFFQENLDLLHVPHFNVPILYMHKTIITIHDLLWHEFQGFSVTTLPKWQYLLKYLGYKIVTQIAILKAKKILVPSQTVKQTLIRYVPVAQNKTIVTYEGIEKNFFQTHNKNKPRQKQFVYIGSLYPHKNIQIILKALPSLPEYTVHIISARTVFLEETRQLINQLQLNQKVEFHHHVSDQDLIDILQESTALIQPSVSEGFGLTGLEAMATGTPVLASNIPVFKEIYADSAIYFNPYSENEFIQAVKKLEKNPPTPNSLVKHAQQFSWKTTAEETLTEYTIA